MNKIFLSYTLRGDDLIVDELFIFKKNLNLLGIDNYIDFIDNNVLKRTKIESNYNINSDAQRKVIKELLSSSVIIVLESNFLKKSEWVDYELNLAQRCNIHSELITKNIWKDFLLENNYEKLLRTQFFKKINFCSK